MTPDQFLLHQLAVMGRDEYHQTLQRTRGEHGQYTTQPSQPGDHDDDDDGDDDSDDDVAERKAIDHPTRMRKKHRTDALKYSMTKSLQLLASGKLDQPTSTTPSTNTSDSKDESIVRQRTNGKKGNTNQTTTQASTQAVASPSPSSSSPSPSASSSPLSDDDVDVSTLVVSRPSKGLNRRALSISLFVGLLLLLLSWYLITHTFQKTFFKTVPMMPKGGLRSI